MSACISACLSVYMLVWLSFCMSVFLSSWLSFWSRSHFLCLLFRVSFSSQLFSCLLCIQVVQAYWVYKLIFYISFLGIQYCTYKFFGYKSFLGYTSFVYTSFSVYKLIGYTRVYKLIVHPGYTSLLFILLIENSNLSSPRTTNPIEVLHFHCFWKTIFT